MSSVKHRALVGFSDHTDDTVLAKGVMITRQPVLLVVREKPSGGRQAELFDARADGYQAAAARIPRLRLVI
jgi:hypothetical protein